MVRRQSPKARAASLRNLKKARAARKGVRKTARKTARTTRKATRRAVRRVRAKNRPKGIIAKVNGFTRMLKLGLPAIGQVMERGVNSQTPRALVARYTGYDMEVGQFNTEAAKTAVGFYSGNVIEQKVMSAVRIPQMAGQKKILSVVANFLPEITAAPLAIQGNTGEALNQYGRASIGYQPTDHQSWIENPTVRLQWMTSLSGRVGLGLISKFAGPTVNKWLPKGVNI